MTFRYSYRVRFSDTDGAGVVYFSRFLEVCHGAYEASLAASGVNLQRFFSGDWQADSEGIDAINQSAPLAFPITETQCKFYSPCFCGDVLTITLAAHLIRESEFEVNYQWQRKTDGTNTGIIRPSGMATTRHVCVAVGNGRSRRRCPLPPAMHHWLSFVAGESAGKSAEKSAGEFSGGTSEVSPS